MRLMSAIGTARAPVDGMFDIFFVFGIEIERIGNFGFDLM